MFKDKNEPKEKKPQNEQKGKKKYIEKREEEKGEQKKQPSLKGKNPYEMMLSEDESDS